MTPPSDLQEGLQSTQKIATASLKKDDNNAKWELKQQVCFATSLTDVTPLHAVTNHGLAPVNCTCSISSHILQHQ